MSKIVVLQHIAVETPGILKDLVDQKGFQIQTVRGFEGEKIPQQISEADALLIMGGPMGVYEDAKYPFLRDEKKLIETVLKDEKPILGICLGSQLLAAVLGSEVKPGGRKEIGWYPVTLSKEAPEDPLWTGAPESFEACHWHGDVYNLPGGATRLASSKLTENQAFRYAQNAYGFLFHMEITEAMLQNWVREFTDELKQENLEGQTILKQGQQNFPSVHQVGNLVFDRWLCLIESREKQSKA